MSFLTFQQLAILLGPVFVLAFILDQLSQFVEARAARILGLDVYTYLAAGVMVHELGHAFFCVISGIGSSACGCLSVRADGASDRCSIPTTPESVPENRKLLHRHRTDLVWNRVGVPAGLGSSGFDRGPYGCSSAYHQRSRKPGGHVIGSRRTDAAALHVALATRGGFDLAVLALRLSFVLHRQPHHPEQTRYQQRSRVAGGVCVPSQSDNVVVWAAILAPACQELCRNWWFSTPPSRWLSA